MKIDAVNMSIGGGKYTAYCDSKQKVRKDLFDKMIAAGMLPVVAAGNEKYNNATTAPGCISSSYTVAALTNHTSPYIASYSNMNKSIIDIAAPGTKIYSAVIKNTSKDPRTGEEKVTCTENCYGYKNGTSMATPMVTGSIALVKQLYPGMSVLDAGKYLKDISTKVVSKRVNRENTKVTYTFPFKKPVLDLYNILKWFNISDSAVKAEKGKVTVTFEDTSILEKYQIRVYDENNKKVKNVKFTSTTDVDVFNTLKITGNFQEGKVYRLEIKRWFVMDPETAVTTVKYFYTFPIPKTLTAGVRNNGVSLNMHMKADESRNHVIYRVYDWQTNNVVKLIDTSYGDLAQTVSGLNNGQSYFVTGQFYRDIAAGKKKVRVYGMESDPIHFVPMNDSFGCRYGASLVGVTINCPEDPAASGIEVLYRPLDGNFNVQKGCISNKGEFSCKVQDPSLLKGSQQFIVMKYYDDDGFLWNSSSTVVTRLGKQFLIPRPEKPLIYFDDNREEITISFADLGDSDGIVVFGKNNTGEYSLFCNSNRRSCFGNTREDSYLVMRYKRDDGKVYFSPGVHLFNNWGSN